MVRPFTGDAGNGESNIEWILDNDLLECIVQLPDQLFFNTGITTIFGWFLIKNQMKEKDKVQLIDASSFTEYEKVSW